jgi:hypothetical protein
LASSFVRRRAPLFDPLFGFGIAAVTGFGQQGGRLKPLGLGLQHVVPVQRVDALPALRVVEFAFLERDRAFNAGAFFEQFPGVGLER